MLANYFSIAIRNIRKHFTYSAINITGLGIGLATCFLLALWIRHELSFDQFHVNKDRIYRVSLEYSFGGQTAKTSVSPTALLPALEKNFGEVESGVRFFNAGSNNPIILRHGDKLFEESRFYYADSTFFDVFTFPLIEGDAHTALVQPYSVMLTESMAKKYFGDQSPMGQTIRVSNRQEYTVTGILKDLPSQSMLRFDFLASFSSLPAATETIWWSANYQTYALLSPAASLPSLSEKVNKLVAEELKSELSAPGDFVKYNFTPLLSLYLQSETSEPEVVGSMQYIIIFSAIALMILFIACINYVNLATAKATERAREVGVRKVVGAHRSQLFAQFISESVLTVFTSFLIAIAISSLALPFFNDLTGKAFSVTDLLAPDFLFIAMSLLLVLAVASGAYPAILISSFRPTQILKGSFKTSGKGVWLRKTLVTFQFSISLILLISTLVILKQLQFIQTQRLGYDKESIIVLPMDRTTRETYPQLKTEFLRSGEVVSVGRATESPTRIQGGYSVNIPGASDRGMLVTAMSIDENFAPTLGMEITAGRNLTEEDMKRLVADTAYSFILNESALKEMNVTTENAIGMPLRLNGRNGQVIGIVKDFHYSTLHEKIGPLVLFSDDPGNTQVNLMFLKLKTGSVTSQIEKIKSICTNLLPHRPFDYTFLDDRLQSLYLAEQRMSKICMVFASMAIFIACLGLLGLVSFAATQKTKEIGIRKVMGASFNHIVLLITKDFGVLILVAVVLGVPASWYLMENLWLSQFAYRTNIGSMPFIAASLFCFLIALLTSAYQAIKAALLNPATTLRNE